MSYLQILQKGRNGGYWISDGGVIIAQRPYAAPLASPTLDKLFLIFLDIFHFTLDNYLLSTLAELDLKLFFNHDNIFSPQRLLDWDQ